MNTPLPDPDAFRMAMRGLASGVSLVTTRDADGHPRGMAATAVCSVSAEPPSLLVCINKSTDMHDRLIRAGHFAINFVAADQHGLVRTFSNPAERETRFHNGSWTALETGAPILLGATASLDCRLERTLEAGSHTVVFGTVVATRSATGAAAPLVYHDGKMNGLARIA